MVDADQLLLEWASKEAKPWLQSQLEEHNRYKPKLFIDKLYEMAYLIKGATLEHLVNCSPRVYGIPGHEWECGCYSEYTRDDNWMIHAYVTCSHGLFAQMVQRLDSWDMPEVLRQLAEEDEGCAYDDPDY